MSTRTKAMSNDEGACEMTQQQIRLDGEVVAVAAAGQLVVDESVDDGSRLATVQAMGLYALEIEAGAIAGPYSDQDALRYAAAAAVAAPYQDGVPAHPWG
jgi:hypothetical protein